MSSITPARVSASTLPLHHTILQRALRKATKDRPSRRTWPPTWTQAAAHAAVARGRPEALLDSDRGPRLPDGCPGGRPAAGGVLRLALDSGARKGELCGLTWANLDLDAGKMRIVQQLLKPGRSRCSGRPRPDGRGPCRRRRDGRGCSGPSPAPARAEDGEPDELPRPRPGLRQGMVGPATEGRHARDPLQINNLGQREYAAGHQGGRREAGSSSTACATPARRCSCRRGRRSTWSASGSATRKVSMTMEVYAHVLPDMQQEAAADARRHPPRQSVSRPLANPPETPRFCEGI